MPKKPPSRTFHVRLLRESITAPQEALKTPELGEVPLGDGLAFSAALFLKPANETEPWWVGFLEAGAGTAIEAVVNISTGALLLITVDSRIFAISFGYGHTLLTSGSWEVGFGLRVVLNCVDPDRLQSIDKRTLEDGSTLTRQQVSQLSSVEDFGLDPTTDVLKALTGIPSDKSFAKRVTGSDALAITRDTDFPELAAMCSEILKVYESDAYKKGGRFDWIDHLEDVRNPDLIGQLDELLADAIQGHDSARMQIAPPKIIDWDKIGSFHYSHEDKTETHDDLRIDDLLDSFPDPTVVDVHFLKTRTVRVTYETDELTFNKWPMYRCLVFETSLGNHQYVLTDGKWYRVAKDFVDQVRTYVGTIQICDIKLPTPEKGEREEDYNLRAEKLSQDFLSMDKKTVVYGGGSSSIEFCDILTKKKQFVHVKKRAASSKMSHLLAQGSVSAQAFLGDAEYRKKARSRIAKVSKDFVDIVPLKRPSASEYEVVYAFIGGKGNDPQNLPFFTLLHLMQHAKLLDTLGFVRSVILVPGP